MPFRKDFEKNSGVSMQFAMVDISTNILQQLFYPVIAGMIAETQQIDG
jgi:hypothetical protein